MRLKPLILAISFSYLIPTAAHALEFDFEFLPNPQQEDFRSVAEDIAAVLNSKSLSPAETNGTIGFAFGAFASYVPTEDADAWGRLIGESLDEVGMVGVSAEKGLPFGIEAGASYGWVPGADARIIGLNLKYEILEGGIATPAISLRGSYSSLSGIDEIDYDSRGVDLSISKGIGPLTPYAGVGYVWSDFEIQDPVLVPLEDESVDEARFFVGARLSALFGITPEFERVGDRNAFNLRIGFTF